MLNVLSQSFRVATRTDGWCAVPMMVVSAGSHRSAHRTPRDLLRDAGRRLVGRRAGSELLKMNDHVLADLGLTRAAVLELVRRGRVAERRD